MVDNMMSSFLRRFTDEDKAISSWMAGHGVTLLRYSIAVVFIWFGGLKILGMSPASELVAHTVAWFDPSWFIPVLGWWEVIIGVCFLYRPLLRVALFLLAPQMAGTFLPLLLLPSITFQAGNYLYPTLEGQYIIKNLVIISAAIVIGSTVRSRSDVVASK